MRINFGKFKGEEVCDLPAYYIVWLCENVDLEGKLLVEVTAMYEQAKDEVEQEEVIINENRWEIY